MKQSSVRLTMAALGFWGAVASFAGDWPMWRYDAGRSAQAEAALPSDLHPHWTLELPEPRRAWSAQVDEGSSLEFDVSYEPVAAGGRLFVPSMTTDSVTAYDLDTGAEQWRFYADGPVRLAPAYSAGRLYFGSDDGVLYCLDAATGEERWRFRAAPSTRMVLGNRRLISVWPVRGAPLVHEGTVYFTAGFWPFEGVYICALDAGTGRVRWMNSGAGDWGRIPRVSGFTAIAPQGYLTMDGDRLIVSGGRVGGRIYDRRTGAELPESGPRSGYAVSATARHYVLDRSALARIRTGENQSHDAGAWSRKIEGDVWRLLAAGGRMIAVTRCGRIHVWGPGKREPVVHQRRSGDLARVRDVWTERAATLLADAGVRRGVALMFGIGSGRLLEELLAQSELHIVAFDPDADKVRRWRDRYSRAGLYGERVALLEGDAFSHRLPPYMASLIVSEDPAAAGREPGAVLAKALFHPLRPYGGLVYLLLSGNEKQAFLAAAKAAGLENAEIAAGADHVTVRRPGALPGSDVWTHQYADAANRVYSDDDRVRAPLGLLFYGNVGNERTLPRHMFGPIPQVAGGRLIMLGRDHVGARCAYTGIELWSVELPGVGEFFTSPAHEDSYGGGRAVYFPSHHGANFIGSPYVSMPDGVYVVHQNRCLRLDPATGETLAAFALPDRAALRLKAGAEGPDSSYAARVAVESDARWGSMRVSGRHLIVAAYPHVFTPRPERPDLESPRGQGHIVPERGVPWHWNATSSEYLLAMDRYSGEIKWALQARHGFRHNAIAASNGRVFVIDNVSSEIHAWLARRGIEPDAKPRVLALDTETGATAWRNDEHAFGTWLSYSKRHDVLLQGGRPGGRSVLPDEFDVDEIMALRGTDGEKLWHMPGGDYSWGNPRRSRGPLALHEEQGRIFPVGRDIRTGEPLPVRHPATGEETGWRIQASKGCGSQLASRHLIAFRSGSAAFQDFGAYPGGTVQLAGIRSGCTDNMIAADGVLNIPDYSRTCTCAFSLQTSAGLSHMPEVEMWTTDDYGSLDLASVPRFGINFGAPGNRVAADGVFWFHYPRRAPGMGLDVRAGTFAYADETVPVHVTDVTDSIRLRGYAGVRGAPEATIDDNPDTHWEAHSCRYRSGFRQATLQYDLSETVTLDGAAVDWTGPEGTRFHIETSADGIEWSDAAAEQSDGTGGELRVYRFEPRPARHVRIFFDEHDGEPRSSAKVLSVRIGDLPHPQAYAHYAGAPELTEYRQHSLLFEADEGHPWVAATGFAGVQRLVVNGLRQDETSYAVKLHFAEPDELTPGERVFRVRIQGQTVLDGFDPVREAGGRRRGLVREFATRSDNGTLTLELVPAPGAKRPPVLAGLEIEMK